MPTDMRSKPSVIPRRSRSSLVWPEMGGQNGVRQRRAVSAKRHGVSRQFQPAHKPVDLLPVLRHDETHHGTVAVMEHMLGKRMLRMALKAGMVYAFHMRALLQCGGQLDSILVLALQTNIHGPHPALAHKAR